MSDGSKLALKRLQVGTGVSCVVPEDGKGDPDSHYDDGFLFGLDGMPCVVLWKPEALDCRVPIPPETWHGFTRNPPERY